MTEKRERILESALRLFAESGYAATSTSKVAKAAGVSEGLIFRHFENKEGLLKALMQEGKDRIKKYFADIVLESDPKVRIHNMIDLPFQIVDREREFWRLQKSLKFQFHQVHKELDFDYAEPLFRAVVDAFTVLGYEEPAREAAFLAALLEGVTLGLIQEDLNDPEDLRQFIKSKYSF